MKGEKPVWEGIFWYAYGHPDSFDISSPHIRLQKVRVTADGIDYLQSRSAWKPFSGYRVVFSIPRNAIRGVRHEQTAAPFMGHPDQFVCVKMLRDNEEHEVRFKAGGVGKQKSAFDFVKAVTRLLSKD